MRVALAVASTPLVVVVAAHEKAERRRKTSSSSARGLSALNGGGRHTRGDHVRLDAIRDNTNSDSSSSNAQSEEYDDDDEMMTMMMTTNKTTKKVSRPARKPKVSKTKMKNERLKDNPPGTSPERENSSSSSSSLSSRQTSTKDKKQLSSTSESSTKSSAAGTRERTATFASRYQGTMQASFGRSDGSSPPRKYERANSIDEELMMSSSNSSHSSYDDHEGGGRRDSYNRGGRSSSSSNPNRNSFRSANVESYNQVLRAFDSVSREDEDDDADENDALKAANVDKFGDDGSDEYDALAISAPGVGQSWAKLELAADTGNAPKALEALEALLEMECAQPLRAYNSALRACKRARPPAYRSATTLLQRMRAQEKSDVKPNQRTYHEVIAAYARAHEWRLAERTFEEMKRDPNVGWHETLDKIAAEYENKTNKDDDDREDDEDSYNNSRYSRSGGGGRYGGGGYGERRPFVARDRKGPSNDIVRVYTSLISAYGKGGQWEKALAAFQELENTPGCFCDTGSHNALLSAAVSAAKYPEAAQLFTSMAKNPRVRRNVTTYNSLITSYGKQRKIGDMESIFAQMARNGVFANETTHAVMIAAHGNNTSTGDKDCKRALDLLTRCARNPKLRCSAVVFNSALGACAKQSDHESFNLVLKMMREEGIVPTLITYNTRLMESTARRDWREAARAYKELLLDGLLPDSITFDCLCGIEKLVLARERMEALALEEEDWKGLKIEALEDDPSTMAAKDVAKRDNAHLNSDDEDDEDEDDDLLSRSNPMGELPDLLLDIIRDEALNAKLKNNKGVQTAAYDAYLRVCYADGRFDEVSDAFSRMISEKVPRTVHTYNSLLISFEASCKWREAENAMNLMKKETPEIFPDALTFDALIDVCEEMGQWDRATQYLEDAQNKYGYLGCEDELGVLDLHRVRSAGTAQCVLRWWLRRMRQRALAPMDIQSAGKGTRTLLTGTSKETLPISIRDLPDEISVVTGWGKHSTVYGRSPVKTRVLATMKALNSPFTVPEKNIGSVVAERGAVRSWLVKEELLSLGRFLLGNRDALKRNFNPMSGPRKVTDEDVLSEATTSKPQ